MRTHVRHFLETRSITLVLLIVVSVTTSLAGCGSDKSTEPGPTPDPYPASSTPEGAVKRFVAVYSAMDSTQFARLLTTDFTFEFSNATDPDLVAQYATGWFKEDEVASATNLFQGGMTSSGDFQPAADSIVLVLQPAIPADDAGNGRDPAKYKVLLTPVTMTIDVPPPPGDTEGTTFLVGAGANPTVHRFYLVRGDVAELGAGQAGDSQHWYIWRWRDESTEQLAPGLQRRSERELLPNQNKSSTWGSVKGLYR